MTVLSVAITLSFHLNSKPTDLERRVSKPLGAVFWILSVVMLVLGLYSEKAAIVQTGWRTQLVSFSLRSVKIG
ncbi:hypothetical protein VFPPC_17639 [Pochonia chlamydosporia 170]|uniref:Uncharacterized protein n=1 Tax=Pochonia chlamydosporia 170 TaxID=1380566 RepID=A0A219ASJ3_METCM|nr:hypothetical protein VFPPC_17639 [Pochonia chlamydosporia 170]OWT43185.1 hypothetical protein VFPPC_17639 [Pochonia chlamydosporia 170]